MIQIQELKNWNSCEEKTFMIQQIALMNIRKQS